MLCKKPMSVFQLILHHQERSLLHHWCISPSQCPAGDSWRVDLRLSSSNHLCKDFSLASRHNLCWRGNPQRCKKWPLPPCSGILVHTLVFNRHTLSQALHTMYCTSWDCSRKSVCPSPSHHLPFSCKTPGNKY